MSEYMDTLIHLICNAGISASVEKEQFATLHEQQLREGMRGQTRKKLKQSHVEKLGALCYDLDNFSRRVHSSYDVHRMMDDSARDFLQAGWTA
eukprot:4155467-Pyramimonas_sp.AAC.1